MTLTIHCDAVDEHFCRCDAELTGLAFGSKPAGWRICTDDDSGDHLDYCPEHAERGDT